MRSVGVNTNVPATKGLAEPNHHNRVELKELRNGAPFDGQWLSEEDESRINDDVNSGRLVEPYQPQGGLPRLHHQGSGPVVQWEQFLPIRSLKVLLVENDDSTRHVVSALLRNCSYEVTAVANGLEAWEVLIDLNKQIDLVLTEVIMPYLSGIGLLSKITNHVSRKNIPIIMMSSDDSMGIVFNCLSKGAVDFLVKPIRKNELKNLWQHVWRKCHSQSSGSGSESGIRDHKSTKSRSVEESGDDSDNSDGDDDVSIELNAKGGSDNGSGTQSSWPKRVVDVDSSQAKSSGDKLPNYPHDITSAPVARPETSKKNWRSTVADREDLTKDDKLEIIEMGKDLEIGVRKSSNFEVKDTNKTRIDTQVHGDNSAPARTVVTPLGATKTSNAHTEALKANHLLNNINIEEKSIYYSKESPTLELSLKRPRDVEDADAEERNLLRHSGLSAFLRYDTVVSNVNQTPTENIGSCSEATKPNNNNNIQSNSNGTHNQRSNGSNDMGSTTNPNKPPATTTLQPPPNIPPSIIDSGDNTVQVRHHHHHYHHHHHHVHKLQQKTKVDEFDDGSGSGSGTGENGGSSAPAAAVGGGGGGGEIERDNCVGKKGGGGDGSGSGSGVDQERLMQREAALNKFRQKRKERCFEKKVRYQSRKKLAEERPRVRGQFVRQGANGVNNEDANS